MEQIRTIIEWISRGVEITAASIIALAAVRAAWLALKTFFARADSLRATVAIRLIRYCGPKASSTLPGTPPLRG